MYMQYIYSIYAGISAVKPVLLIRMSEQKQNKVLSIYT